MPHAKCGQPPREWSAGWNPRGMDPHPVSRCVSCVDVSISSCTDHGEESVLVSRGLLHSAAHTPSFIVRGGRNTREQEFVGLTALTPLTVECHTMLLRRHVQANPSYPSLTVPSCVSLPNLSLIPPQSSDFSPKNTISVGLRFTFGISMIDSMWGLVTLVTLYPCALRAQPAMARCPRAITTALLLLAMAALSSAACSRSSPLRSTVPQIQHARAR